MPAAPRRRLAALLLGPLMVIGLLLGLASPAGAQSFPQPVGIGATPDEIRTINLYFRFGVATDNIEFPIATGGTGGLIYSVTGNPGLESLGFSFDPTTRIFKGTPKLAGAGQAGDGFAFTYRVNSSAGGGFAIIFVKVTVCEGSGSTGGATVCTPPDFAALGFAAALAGQSYTVGTPITALTLPVATGGTGSSPTFIYRLTSFGGLPDGLSFDAATRRLTGTPTTAKQSTLTYRVQDAASLKEFSRQFPLDVNAASVAADTTPPVITFDRFEHTGGVVVDTTTYLNVGDTLTAFVNSDEPLAATSLVDAAFFDFDGSVRSAQDLRPVTNVANQYMATYTITTADDDAGPQFNVRGVTDTADPANTAPDFRHSLGTVTIDTVAPTITLVGGPVTVAHGGTYTEDEDAGISGAGRDETPAMTTTGPDAMTVDGIVVDTTTPGAYLITYIVTDPAGNVADLTRTVTVAPAPLANTAPTSDAGPDQPDEVVGSPVTLDGSGSSDSETAKDDLIYFWSQSDGPDVVLSNDRVVRPTFTPPKAGIYTFDLTVTDTGTPALGSTPTDQVIITVAAAVAADTTPPMITFDRFEHTGGVVVDTTTYLNVGDTLTAFVNSDEPLAATSLVDAAFFDFDGSVRSAQDLRPVTNVANQYMATYTITAADNDAGPQFNVRGVTDTADPANTAPDFRHSLGTVTIDTVAPTITLVGGPVTVAHGGTYTETEDAGISGAARDETPAMTTTGPDAMTVDGIVVDTTTPGDYLITYIVTDPAGNVAELTRTVTVSEPVPEPPVLSAGTPTHNSIALSWGAVDNADSYTLTRVVDGGADVVVFSGNALTATDTGLTPETPYKYVVTATNSAGTSANSNEIDATTLAAPAADTTPPMVTLDTIAEGVIGMAQDYNITFSEAVTGLAVDDFSVSNSIVASGDLVVNSVTPASGPSTTYTISITPRATAFTLTLTADSVTDTATTPNMGPATAASAIGSATAALALSAAVGNQRYTLGTAVDVTLPVATGGTAPLTYALPGPGGADLPPGLSFNAGTRTLSGTPTERAVPGPIVTYMVTDANGASTAVAFFVTVYDRLALISPTTTRFYRVGRKINDLQFLEATGGTLPKTYTLTGPEGADLPPGLSFNAGNRMLSGMPTEAGVTVLTQTATDHNGATAMAHLTIIVNDDVALPDKPDDQFYTVGTAVDVTLPEGIGGTGTLRYTLTGPGGAALPAGLRFDEDTRKLTGTPTEAASATTLTYTVTDNNGSNTLGESDSQTFMVTVAATTPEPPVLSAGTPTHNSIALSWGAVDNADSYTLTRVVVGGADVVVAAATSELTATDTGLTPETSYKYVVTATNSAGTSADSNEVDATTLAAPVTTPEPTVTAERLPDNSIEVSWDNIPGVNFTIYAIKTGENNVIIIDLVTSPHTIATTDPLFDTANDADGIGVRGFAEGNPVGDHSAQITSDEVPDEAPAVTDTTPPTVTLGTIAEGVIDTAQDYDITFSEPVTGLAVDDFSVSNDIVASGDLVVNSVTPASGSSTTYTISITPRATAFTLTLAADSVTDTATTPNMGPAAEASATGTATVTAAPPGAPTNLAAEAGDTTVTLAWTAPGATGGADITGYEYRQSDATGDYDTAGSAAVVDWMAIPNSATATEYTVAGLTNDTAYFFEVRAVNSVGEGEASGEATATPTAPNTAPVIGIADAAVDYAENTPVATAVATYTATDAEGDTVTWTLGGTDAGDFSIDTNGALTFNTVRDFETPDSDATSNTYFVTITATDDGDPNESGTLDVTVTVTNVDDEDGVVAIAITRDGTTVSGAPRVGDTLTASVTDADSGSAGVTGTTWQWQSSSAGTYTDISGATAAAYSPVAGDVGSTLRAVATYNDSTGSGKTATSAPTASVVAIAAPSVTAQALTTSNANTGYAKAGDTLTLTFTVSKALSATPTATIAGQTAPVTTNANEYTATYTVVAPDVADVQGAVTYDIGLLVSMDAGADFDPGEQPSAIVIDTIAPTVSSFDISGSLTAGRQATDDIEFSEPVTGVDAAGFSATNATIDSVTGSVDATTYTIAYTPVMAGKVTLSFAANGATDTAGNTGPATATEASDPRPPAPLVLTAPDDQNYTVDTEIAALTLPAATGGSGALSYTLTGPAGAALPTGLTFDAASRRLTGTPTALATTTLTYTVTDANATASQTFTVTVALPRFADLNRTILPEVARAIAGHTVGAIARRVTQARADGGTDSAGSFNLGGQTTVAGVAGALASHGQAMADGTLSLKDLLGGGDFVLPLNARAAAGAPGLSSLAFWGAGDYSNLDGSGGAVDWDGDLFSAHLGADARLRDDLLVGLAVSWSRVDLDYSDPDRSGDYELDLTSFHPYVGWSALSGKLDLWATVGYGWGDLEIADDEAQQASSDVEMRTVAVGGLGRLLKVGATTLRLKGDALLTEMEVEGSDEMAALTVDARRVRMILEGSRTHTLADGAQLEPSLEVGVRHDGGDGETGFGAELGGGVRYSNPVMGLTLEGRARTLVGRDSYGEWGVNGLIRLERGNGRGLSFNLSPGYGKTVSGTQRLWQQGLHDKIDGERDYGARMDLRLGYGLPAFGGRGLLTPYSEVTFGDSARNYRLGMEWELGALFELNLTGERHESSDGAADHAIMLKGEVRF